ncbi:MAG: D-glycero-beta-D-manno-heptose-7-phosphate kinase [Candidatus Omnitrophica bacterium]|nr:D-glycero-beta-D-manno-heptose-7-phosphate kinase [Candidatus Omnitrophota bacterium]
MYSLASYSKIIEKFKKKNILVIGDVILDQYIQGSVSRISPEAPVPVVVEQNRFYTPGGAANVAQNLKALGAEVVLVSRIGDDLEGRILKEELKKKGVVIESLFVDKNLPTITKVRVLAQHQQIVRIDREKTDELVDKKLFEKICQFIKKHILEFDGIIISDYGKGLITPELVNFVCSLAIQNKKIITVDPKVEHFNYYRQVTSITPNLKEAENAIRNIKITAHAPQELGIRTEKLKTDDDVDLAGKELLKYLDLESLLITLGERGMRLFERGQTPVHISTKAKEVYDVTGAGDAVISAFTLSLTAGANKQQAAEISNFAAGVVVGKLGAATVTAKELVTAIKEY